MGPVALLTLALSLGHAMRSGYLQLDEATQAVSAPPNLRLKLEGCELDPPSRFRCEGGLRGRTLWVEGFDGRMGDAAVRITFADGTSAVAALSALEPRWAIPAAPPGPLEAARRYVALGVLHIASGLDHLLFLLALVCSARRVRAVLVAQAAFTLSHSLSFSATALGLLRVSSAAAEACIALSLVLVALDLARGRPAPAATAFAFGAVHGLGFAGGLAELGVPQSSIPAALLGFAAGVELGQLAWVALALGATALLVRRGLLDRASQLVARLVGGAGALWLLQRLPALL